MGSSPVIDVLTGCECSGAVREEFRERGFNAWSCDLKPAEDGSPYHLQMDVFEAIERMRPRALIAFPDCTYLTISAEWAYGDGPYHQKVKPETLVGAARREAREKAIQFVLRLYDSAEYVAIENPIGALSSRWRKPDVVFQPYQFGDDASKATCLWVKGLPPLRPLPPEQWAQPRIVDGKKRWANQTDSGQNRLSPGEQRATDRARFYPGPARAMAEQWGDFLRRESQPMRENTELLKAMMLYV